MKQIFRKLNLAALVIVGAMAVGCTGALEEIIPNTPEETTPGIPEETQQQPESETVTLTTTISIGTETKALDAAGVKTFAVDDKIALVYKNTGGATVKVESAALTLVDITNEGRNAKFSFEVTAPDKEQDVTYIYPAAMAKSNGTVNYDALAMQDGTLETISGNLDLATYSAAWVDGTSLPSGVLENRLAIGEFTLKNFDGSSNITNTITSLTVSDGTNTYTVTPAAPATKFGEGPIYVAMKPLDGGNLDFTASDGVNFFDKSVSGKTLAAGSMYPVGLKMNTAFDGKATPLTFEAINACTVTYTAADPLMTVQYSKNGGAWTDYSAPINLAAGEILAFRGMNAKYDRSYFTCSEDCYLYGNIMSLVTDYSSDPNAFASNVELTEDDTFYRLFDDDLNSHIKSHASKPIVLPATILTENCYSSLFCHTGLTVAPVLPASSLADQCYSGMFDGCTGLTAAPALPASTLTYGCYDYMFRGCTSLITAPALPATTLAVDCYDSMFRGCTSLTTAPALPATTMEWMCYEDMFKDCTSLTAAPALPATTLAEECYQSMFSGCTSLTAAPALPATTLAVECYQYMFYGCESLTAVPSVLPATKLESDCYAGMFFGCTSLTAAPVLPATILVDGCYYNMFNDCTNLNSITSYAVYIPNSGCTEEWVEGVSGSGSFQINPILDPLEPEPWEENNSWGIPAGWTVERHPVATKALANASWEDVGRIVGADGNIYSTVAEAEAASTTAEAMVAFLGAVDGVCEHGLAISLTNVSDSESWSDIDDIISTWASSHSIPGVSWRLPSFKDWQYLLIGTYIEDPDYYDYITTTNVLLSGVGGSLSDGEYWSSTSVDEYYAHIISYGYGECTLNCQADKEGDEYVVRACFSF